MPAGKDADVAKSEGKRGVLAAALVLALVLAAAALCYNLIAGGSGSSGGVDSKAAGGQDDGAMWLSDYDATVYAQQDVALTLSQIADGRPLVVNFWATWCPYCLQEMDDYREIHDEYGEKVAFAFVDATDGVRETASAASEWVEESGYDLPFYYDLGQEAVRSFGISAYPTTVVVAADGEIMAVTPGVINPSRMRQALDTLL